MKTLSKVTVLIALALGVASAARAATIVLDFEDRAGLDQTNVGLANYHGVAFDENFFTYTDAQFPYTPSSGITRAAVNEKKVGVGESFFSFLNGPVNFLGAYISGGYSTQPIYFNLYANNALVGTSGSLVSSSTPTWLSSGYAGVVDKVGLYGYRGYFVFDDLTYKTAASVPDAASTFALAGAALVGLVAFRRRLSA